MNQIGEIFIKGMCAQALQHGGDNQLIQKIMQDKDYPGRLKDVASMIRTLRHDLSDEYMGFTAKPCIPGTFYYAVKLGLQAGNLGGFLTEVMTFYRIFAPAVESATTFEGEDCTVSMELFNPELDPEGIYRLYTVISLHRLSSWVIAKRVPLKRVAFNHAQVADIKDYQMTFDCEVAFDAPKTSLTFPRKYLMEACVQKESQLQEYIARRPLDILIMPAEDNSYSKKIKQLAFAHQSDGNPLPSLDELASGFNMSPQTLRRHLSSEGGNYRQIKDEVRKEVAVDKLVSTGLTVSDVAILAGFQEVNSFFRAFKRWYGISPTEYREKYAK